MSVRRAVGLRLKSGDDSRGCGICRRTPDPLVFPSGVRGGMVTFGWQYAGNQCRLGKAFRRKPETHAKIIVKRSHFNGFTLVELLVVGTIIGVLGALLLPALVKSKQKAQRIQCVSNLRQVEAFLQMYVTDNNGYPYAQLWSGELSRMIGRRAVSTPQGQETTWAHLWDCPVAPSHKVSTNDFYMSYGYNAYGYTEFDAVTNSLGLGTHDGPRRVGANGVPLNAAPVKEAEIAAPSDMIAVGDSFRSTVQGRFVRDGGYYLWCTDWLDADLIAETTKRSYARHQGEVNVAFCDGHVESIKMLALFSDSNEALSRWNRDHQPHPERIPH